MVHLKWTKISKNSQFDGKKLIIIQLDLKIVYVWVVSKGFCVVSKCFVCVVCVF